MPKSKKRVKKNQEVQTFKSSNPMKTWWGKTIIIVLAAAFVLSILVGLIYNMIQIMR